MNEYNFKLDTSFTLKVEVATKTKPLKKLTKKQVRIIWEEVGEDCRRAFFKSITGAGLTNGNYAYDLNDISQMAYLHFAAVTRKFDCSFYKNVTKTKNIQGKKGAKKLSWYFLAYYQQAVNMIQKENREKKLQKLGVFSKEAKMIKDKPFLKESLIQREVKFKEPEINPSEEVGGMLVKLLKKELAFYSPQFRTFFYQWFGENLTSLDEKYSVERRDLKKKHPNYVKLKKELDEFLTGFKRKYRSAFFEEQK